MSERPPPIEYRHPDTPERIDTPEAELRSESRLLIGFATFAIGAALLANPFVVWLLRDHPRTTSNLGSSWVIVWLSIAWTTGIIVLVVRSLRPSTRRSDHLPAIVFLALALLTAIDLFSWYLLAMSQL